MNENTTSTNTEVAISSDTHEMLKSISLGVGAVLWLLLVHTLVWPIAATISGTMDMPLIAYGTFVWAVPIAMLLALLLTRLVFPVNYTKVVGTDRSA